MTERFSELKLDLKPLIVFLVRWDRQWWIGATCLGSHSEHNWGDWRWDSTGTEVQW